ncbi:MAG: hypothetical protein AAGI54_09845 [Planctomycetota bacterium]
MPDVELTVKLRGIELEDQHVRHLNAEIQSLTMREIAKLDTAPEELLIKLPGGPGYHGISIERP